eukprot:Mrub_06334.p1 GENE.Mrub_06334~~Mrub_06334.p1  ORF type:complete len:320 (+),score=70.55 Mrub_06334:2-961(+)
MMINNIRDKFNTMMNNRQFTIYIKENIKLNIKKYEDFLVKFGLTELNEILKEDINKDENSMILSKFIDKKRQEHYGVSKLYYYYNIIEIMITKHKEDSYEYIKLNNLLLMIESKLGSQKLTEEIENLNQKIKKEPFKKTYYRTKSIINSKDLIKDLDDTPIKLNLSEIDEVEDENKCNLLNKQDSSNLKGHYAGTFPKFENKSEFDHLNNMKMNLDPKKFIIEKLKLPKIHKLSCSPNKTYGIKPGLSKNIEIILNRNLYKNTYIDSPSKNLNDNILSSKLSNQSYFDKQNINKMAKYRSNLSRLDNKSFYQDLKNYFN